MASAQPHSTVTRVGLERGARGSGRGRAGKVLSLVLVVAAALLLSIGAYLAWPTGVTQASQVNIEASTYQTSMSQCLGRSETVNRLECVQGLIGTAVDGKDFGGAIALARQAVEEDPLLFTGPCHNQAHLLGKAIVENGMHYEEAYKIPFPDCRYGFYHGALEAYVAPMGFDEVKQRLTQMCTYFGTQDSDPVRECVHVTGHFLVDRGEANLNKAVTACEEFGTGQLYSRCLDGVLMQTAFLMTPGPTVEPAQAQEYREKVWGGQDQSAIESVCAGLPNEDAQETCFTKAALFWSLSWGQDYPRIGKACSAVENERWRKGCFEGIAAVPLNQGIWDPAFITDICLQVGSRPGTLSCMRSMSLSFGVQLDDKAVANVCQSAPEWAADVCQSALAEGKAIRAQLGQAAGTVTTN